jgi:lipopolysaccharide transport system ATP-binding protein
VTDLAIRARDIGKRYRIGHQGSEYKTIREALVGAAAAPLRNFSRLRSLTKFENDTDAVSADVIWALREVGFEVKQGEVVGIIGPNGAGKSTLLKVLSRITEPTTGFAEIRGRVSSLLEVGTGFHQELTGRENIYLNGTILGMRKKEIDRKFDEIVDFSGVEQFIDTPVKRYSSGMQVRLAFAVAAHLEPEILIIDEVLAVGDAAFQKKCVDKMGSVALEGRTILFVSHNMAAIRNLCSRALLLTGGRIRSLGAPGDVIADYLRRARDDKSRDLEHRSDRLGSGLLRWQRLSFEKLDGGLAGAVSAGEGLAVRLNYLCRDKLPAASNIEVGLTFSDLYGDRLFLCSNALTGEAQQGWDRRGEVVCRIPELLLTPGTYRVNVYAKVDGDVADHIDQAAMFEVDNCDFFQTVDMPPGSLGRCFVKHSWELE